MYFVIKVGDSPPDIKDPIVVPQMPSFKPIHIEPVKFEPILPTDPDEIRNHKPEDGENYVSFSTSSFSHSSDIDGVKSSGGGSNTVVNDNGDVQEDGVRFKQNDEPK